MSTFASSYVGDGLASIVQAAVDLKIGSSATIAYRPGEPGGHLILFGGAGGSTVYVQIVLFPTFDLTTGTWAVPWPKSFWLATARKVTAGRQAA